MKRFFLISGMVTGSLMLGCQGDEKSSESTLKADESASSLPSLDGLVVRNITEGCDYGTRSVTYNEAKANLAKIKTAPGMGPWHIVRLADGGSVDGPRYGGQARASDGRPLQHILCTTSVPENFDPQLAISQLGKELTFVGPFSDSEDWLRHSQYYIDLVNQKRREANVADVSELVNLASYISFIKGEDGRYQFHIAISHHISGPHSFTLFDTTFPSSYDCQFKFSDRLVQEMICRDHDRTKLVWNFNRVSGNDYAIKFNNGVNWVSMIDGTAEFTNQFGVIESHRRF